jgi:hypothetical protein
MSARQSPLIALGNLQNLLKQEIILEESAAAQCASSSPGISDAHLQLLAVRKLCFLTHVLVVSPTSVRDPKALTTMICALSLDDCDIPFPQFATADIGAFRPLISRIAPGRSAPSLLANFCRDVPFQSPDVVTFSLIPAFYGYFWSQECVMDFVSFLIGLSARDQRLLPVWGRVLFVIPEFLSFFGEVLSQLALRPDDVTSMLQIDRLFKQFRELWTSTRYLCPSYVIAFLRGVRNPETLLDECFFIPLFQNPQAYGFTTRNNCWTPDIHKLLSQTFSSHARELCTLLTAAGVTPVSLLSGEDTRLVCPDVDTTYVFCYDDLRALCELSHSVARQTRGLAGVEIPADLPTRGLYRLSLPSDKPSAPPPADPLEEHLRKILVKSAPLPVRAGMAGGVFELMRLAAFTSPPERRVVLRAWVQQLQQLWPDADSAAMVERLTAGLQSRAPRHDAALRRLSASVEAVVQLQGGLSPELAHRRWQTAWLLQAGVLRQWAGNRFTLTHEESSEELAARVIAISKEWKNEQSVHGYEFDLEFFVLFDFIVTALPFNEFREKNPVLKKADEFADRAFKNSKIVADWTKSGDEWKARVLAEPQLAVEFPKKLAACYAARSPIRAILQFYEMRQFSRAIMELELSDSEIQVYLLYARDVGKPPCFISWTAYIARTFTWLFQELQIGKDTDWAEPSLTYIFKFLPRIADAVNEMMSLPKDLVSQMVAKSINVEIGNSPLARR